MPGSRFVIGFDGAEPAHHLSDDGDARLELSDVRKLVRRTQRRIVGAAREADRVTFPKLILEHLGTDRSSVDVVEETWPSYEHVNVQVGLDAWLERPGRSHTLLGVANFRHRDFDLSELMRLVGAGPLPRADSRQRVQAQPADRPVGRGARVCPVRGLPGQRG